MAKIDTIISDLGGVLINVSHSNLYSDLARYSQLSADEIARHFDPKVLKGLEVDLGKGLLPPEKFFELLSKELILKELSPKEFEHIYSDLFTRKEDAISFLRQLSRKYVIAMLSNTNEMHYRYWIKTLGEDIKIFKELILSFRTGLAKPDAKIFLEAARRLGVEPQRCVFIDDVEAYVEAARKVGMSGIRFVSVQQLKDDLAKLGVTA